MKIRIILVIILLIGLAVWGGVAIMIVNRNRNMPSRIKRQAEAERGVLKAKFRDKERRLKNDYRQKKYLATGETVYDRIFNAKEHTIIELIEKMAAESLPKSWKCEVRVEEFTHFILLVYLPHNLPSVEANDIASYLNPIIKHCSQWLTDISIFDSKHKSYLFFDNITIRHLEKMEHLTDELLEKVKQQGDSFTRFNSKTIQCEKHNGHLFLPIEITGPNGVLSCMALLDTGASITTISQGIIAQTGSDHLTNAPRQTFQTANGWMSCPVVHRTVDIGGFRQDISIAVNQRDEINLLGMNYFQGLRYIVDSSNSCIYVWAK